MTAPYLDRPLLPIAVVLPRMLEKIENQLAGKSAGAADNRQLRKRAELIRRLLGQELIT
jgi:hypothetical protein